MCELLIKGTSSQIVTSVGCYGVGDIVEVREDGALYGLCECQPDFFVVRLPGKTRSDCEYLSLPELDIAGEMLTRRRYKLVLSAQEIANIEKSNWMIPDISISRIIDKTKV